MRHLFFAVAVLLSAQLQAALRVETVAVGFNGSGDVAVAPNGDIFVGDYGVTLGSSTGSHFLLVDD